MVNLKAKTYKPAINLSLLAVCLLASVFLFNIHKIASFDYWTHLAMGREFINQGKISIAEPFLAGLKGQPADITEWPFQLLIYAINQVGGAVLVSVFVAFIAVLTAIAYLPLLSKEPTKKILGALFVGAVFFIARERYAPRPEVLVYLLFAIALTLAERWRGKPDFGKLAAIVSIFVCWAALHVSWPLGVGAVMLTLLASPNIPFWRSAITTGRGIFLSVVFGVLSLIGALYIAKFAYSIFAGMAAGGNLAFISEMQPVWEFPEVAAKYAFGAFFALALAWGPSAGRLWRILRWVAFLLLGALAARNYGMALLIMIPVALEGLNNSSFSRSAKTNRLFKGLAVALFALMVGVCSLDRDPEWGFGVHDELFPLKAAAFVKDKELTPPIFNSFDIGGSLNWAWRGDPPTYIDPRSLGGKAHIDLYESIMVGGSSLSKLDSEGINTILIRSVFQNSGRIYPLVHILRVAKNWRLLDASDALVFTRATLSPEVETIDGSRLWSFVERESRMITGLGREAPHAGYSRAVALLMLGNIEESRLLFKEAMEKAPLLKPYYYRYIAEVGLKP